jgi:hypothetical protein
VQPSGISASKEIVAQAIVFLSVFKGLVFLINDLVQGRVHHALGDAEDGIHNENASEV